MSFPESFGNLGRVAKDQIGGTADANRCNDGHAEWLRHLHRILQACLANGSVSLRRVAAQEAMSPRGLQRRLQHAGTTWRQELDGARRQQAEHLLAAGEASRTSIARRLAYADGRSLRRAMRRWTVS